MSSDVTISSAGVTTIQANSVALATDTSGNFVATVADSGNGFFTVGNSGSENAAVTLDMVADSLDFTELSDTLVLDAATSITGTAGEVLSFSRTLTNATTENGLLLSVTPADTTSGTTAQYGFYIDNVASTEALDGILVLDNSDANDTVTDGILFIDAGGGITDAIDVSDSDIVNAINVGANTILGLRYAAFGVHW